MLMINYTIKILFLDKFVKATLWLDRILIMIYHLNTPIPMVGVEKGKDEAREYINQF